ncbi:kinesin-like protein KIN-14F isoform X2 [Setaria viridis]|uniref:kinesin-like protein KIN-14F isoform X2 n=1 Tax=Setaria viridis TaxID=4556 RepID=UPI003B3B91B2
MEPAAWESSLPEGPLEEEFGAALRNGLVLCKVLNRVNPSAVPKVMENRVITAQTFEDMRNFLVAVSAMNLLTFETSDVEKFDLLNCKAERKVHLQC